MLSVFARSGLYGQPTLTDILADIFNKKDWNTIDKTLLESVSMTADCVDVKVVEEKVHRSLRKLLDTSNGVLDLYGPESNLLDDIGCYSWYHHDLDVGYFDSIKRPFFSKVHGFKVILMSVFNQWPVGNKIVDLFVESLISKMERQLAGTYELIPASWVTVIVDEFSKVRKTSFPPAELTVTRSEWKVYSADSSPTTDSPLVYKYTDYHKIFDEEHDEDLIDLFKKYLEEHNSSPVMFSSDQIRKFMQMDSIISVQLSILETIKTNPYPFIPFSESRKNLGSMYPSEVPVIRLIFLENDQFLFVKDVDYAIKRALINKKRKPVVPDGMLRLESAEEIKNGTFYMIPRSEYLKVLKKLKVDEKDITLFVDTVARSRSTSVSIFSPYGTKCKSEIDVFYELLNILMIELRVWDRNNRHRSEELNEKIEEVCKMFLDPTKPRCFIDCSRIEQLKDHLRTSAGAFGIPDNCREQLPFAPYPAHLTVAVLQHNLSQIPSLGKDVKKHAHFVNAQRSCVISNKTISPLEYLMAIRDCIAIGLIEKIPLLYKYICAHKMCLQQGVIWCNQCVVNQSNRDIKKPNGNAILLEEEDFDVEFESFDWTRTSFGVMKNRKIGQKLITNYMAVTYLMNQLINHPIPKVENFMTKIPLKIPKTLNESPFLITTDELEFFKKDFNEKFESLYNQHNRVGSLVTELSREKTLFNVMEDLLNYACEYLKNALSFEKYLPNRIYFPFYTAQRNATTGVSRKLFLRTGEFFSLLMMRMHQQGSGVTAEQFAEFYKLILVVQHEGIWLPMDDCWLKNVLSVVGMDSDSFILVPKLFCQIDDVPLKVSRKLQSGSKDEKTIARAIEELKKSKTLVAEKESQLKALAEKLAEKEKVLEQKCKALETEQKEIQRLLKQDTRKTAELDKIQRENRKLQEAVKTHEKQLKIKEEQWKTETASSTASKNAEIQMLKQQLLEKENQVKNREKNHETLTRSLRADLSNCQKEKGALTTQLAEASAKIQDIETSRVTRPNVDAQLAAMTRQNEELLSENQIWQSRLQTETMKSAECQQQNKRLQENIRCLENQLGTRETSAAPPALPAPNAPNAWGRLSVHVPPRSGSSSPPPGSSQPSPVLPVVSRPAPASLLPETPRPNDAGPPTPYEPATLPTFTPAPAPAPSLPECSICLCDITRNARTIRCSHCRNPFHKSCINEWTTTKPTCPNCRGNFPNPRNFPPLGGR